MKEKDFQAEIARSIPHLNSTLKNPVHYCKIPDIPRGPEQRFSPRRGYDCYLVYKGQMHALELKMCKGMSWGFDHLDSYQEEMLREVDAAGGKAYLVINFRVTFSTKEARKRGTSSAILAFAVPVVRVLEARADACKASLPLSWFEENALPLPALKMETGRGWDLSVLLRYPSSVLDRYF